MAVNAIIHDARIQTDDPIQGCYRRISILQEHIRSLQEENSQLREKMWILQVQAASGSPSPSQNTVGENN